MIPDLPLDEEQKKAVFTKVNTVVSAGAGSGKTRVLAYRYFYLLATGQAKVENLLALTFTRKAAAEMYERIYYLLLKEKEKYPRLQEALSHFDKAQISTIDSFCAQIARNGAAAFGLPGSFSEDSEHLEEEIRSLALDFLLKHSESAGLGEMIHAVDFERVWEELFVPLGMSHFILGRKFDFPGMAEKQQSLLQRDLRSVIEELEECSSDICRLPPGNYSTLTQAQAKTGTIKRIPLPEDSGLTASFLDRLLVQVSEAYNYRKPGSNAKDSSLVLLYGYTERARDLLIKLKDIIPTLAGMGWIREVLLLCGEFQELVLNRKRKTGLLSYADISSLALETLKHNAEIRSYYKNLFRYIMVDEFQDTNLMQKELIYLLAEKKSQTEQGIPAGEDLEEGKLFFVGDEKQSIYRFRDADVSVFKKLLREMVSTKGAHLSLSTNYRSLPGLIDFYNLLFAEVMKDAREDYEAEFSKLEKRAGSFQHPQIRIFYKPYVSETLEEQEEETYKNDESEAFHIARYIKTTVEQGDLKVFEEESGILRPAEYRDFAVLLRSTGNQILYERMFRRLSIPYTTQNIRSLFLEAPLNDFYSLFQSLVYPGDRVAYAALLRSPFVNLSDEYLTLLLRPGEEEMEPFSLERLPEDATQEEQRKYQKGRGMYLYMKERVDRSPLRGLVFDGWYRFGYRFSLLRKKSYHPYLEFYQYLSALAGEADKKGLPMVRFLDSLRGNLGKYERLKELPVLQDLGNEVKIMTIHKSKGLEFPIVILANMGTAGNRNKSAPFYYQDDVGFSLLIKVQEGKGKKKGVNYFYKQGEEEDKLKELAEQKRLLYVACTRAKDHLILSGCHKRGNRSLKDLHLNLILNALGGIEGAKPWMEEIPDYTEEDLNKAAGFPRQEEARIVLEPLYLRAGKEKRQYLPTEVTATDLNARHRLPITVKRLNNPDPFELKSDPALAERSLEASFGTLCHWFLQQFLDNGIATSMENPPLEVLGGIPAKERILVVEDAYSLARRFFSTSLGKEVLAAQEKRAEYPFLLKIETIGAGVRLVRGVFDLFFRTGEGIGIVDFKTDRKAEPQNYGTQFLLYVRAAQELFRRPVRFYGVYLRSMEIISVDIPESLPKIIEGLIDKWTQGLLTSV